MHVEILTEDARWGDLADVAGRSCTATLTHLGLDSHTWEIGLLACDDARIATLNSDFRGKSQPTNVLSWPNEDLSSDAPGARPATPSGQDPTLGDIALAYDTCTREAAEAGLTLEAHATHLLVHATLHLLGYDHIDDADAALMEQTEVAILATLGVANPY